MIRLKLCVRCGVEPREEDLFVCRACRVDPCVRRETKVARERTFDGMEQRRLLVAEFGWKGGWSSRGA